MSAVVEDMKRAVFRIAETAPSYGGPSLSEAIEDVDVETALYRLDDTGRCIWEILLHAAYWRREVAHALTDGDLSRMNRGPDNWPAVPDTINTAAWNADRSELRASEEAFVLAIDRFDLEQWTNTPSAGSAWTFGQLAIGLLPHDAYHIGQVVLLKKAALLTSKG